MRLIFMLNNFAC